MAADGPALCITRSSENIVFTMQNNRALIFHKERYYLHHLCVEKWEKMQLEIVD